MQQPTFNTPVVSGSDLPSANQDHDRCREYYLLPFVKQILWNLKYLVANSLCILWSATRSWVGHIRSQSPTKRNEVGAGPAFERDQDGGYRENLRTKYRVSCIENLSATHPWVDRIDLRNFLLGFDAGEEWILRKRDNETKKPMT